MSFNPNDIKQMHQAYFELRRENERLTERCAAYREEREAARDHAEALSKKLSEAMERERRLREFIRKAHDVPPIGVEEIRAMQEAARAALSGEAKP